MKKIITNSSLPRSGSTLLCNILAQNPNIHSTHTSGCLDVLFGVRNSWDDLIEHKAHPLPQTKLNVLRAILNAYYQDVGKGVIIDKSRGWPAYIEMLEEILEHKAKIIVCIRPIPDVLASLEKLNRITSKTRNPPGERQNYFQFQTQEGRCEHWLHGNSLVGLARNRIIDAVNRGFRNRLHFVEYNNLTGAPLQTLKKLYDFLEEPYFEKHDFNHVEQVTQEDDAVHGYVNLHKIQPKVAFKPSDAVEILGERLVKKYNQFNL